MNEERNFDHDPTNGSAARGAETREVIAASFGHLRSLEEEVVGLAAGSLAHGLGATAKVAHHAVQTSSGVAGDILNASESLGLAGLETLERLGRRLASASGEIFREAALASGQSFRASAAQLADAALEITDHAEKVAVRSLRAASEAARGTLDFTRVILSGGTALAGEASADALGVFQALAVTAVDGAGEITVAALVKPRLGVASFLAHARETAAAERPLAN